MRGFKEAEESAGAWARRLVRAFAFVDEGDEGAPGWGWEAEFACAEKSTDNPGCETDDDNHHDYDCGDCARGETGGFVAFAEEGMISFPGRIGAWENHGD